MAYEEIIDSYLKLCKNACDHGGYTRLSSAEEAIASSVSHKFSGNGYEPGTVSRVIDISQTVLYAHLSVGRHFSWPSHLEEGVRNGISSALQEV